MTELLQNSEEWKRWRKLKIGGSDAPVILGVSPYTTPYELWLDKTGIRPAETASNWAIERGTKLEPAARAIYELEVGIDMPAAIKVHPRYDFLIASLDGFNEEHKLVLEIKVAGKEVFDAAKAGRVHEKYYPQVQHQLACSGGVENHFFVCKAEKNLSEHVIVDAALVQVKPDEAYIKEMIAKELEFYKLVQEKIPPPLMDRDVMYAEDEATVMLFSRLKKAKQLLDQVDKKHDLVFQELTATKEEFEEVKAEAIEHATSVLKHVNISAVGVVLRKSKSGVWSVSLKPCNEV